MSCCRNRSATVDRTIRNRASTAAGLQTLLARALYAANNRRREEPSAAHHPTMCAASTARLNTRLSSTVTKPFRTRYNGAGEHTAADAYTSPRSSPTPRCAAEYHIYRTPEFLPALAPVRRPPVGRHGTVSASPGHRTPP